ncbi:MAG: CDP-alcohol phosphatidyltransferase family protein [Bryobacteraceae bacterium]|jgi:phosphatidylglycerophosphate synthase
MPTEEGFTNAKREHRSILASIEKKALVWMAARMPRWVNSDHLTALGFIALLGIAAAYYWARTSKAGFAVASALFIVNWFGDSLDGTLARVRNQQRPRYGFYIDHVLDTLGSVFVFGGLALSGYMSERVALGLLVAWLLLSVEVYLATYTLGTFHLSFAAFGPTEFRLLMIAGNIAVLYRPVVTLLGHRYLLFDVGGVIGAAGMLLAFLWSAVKHGAELYRAETLR